MATGKLIIAKVVTTRASYYTKKEAVYFTNRTKTGWTKDPDLALVLDRSLGFALGNAIRTMEKELGQGDRISLLEEGAGL